jgi:hypothetical protein
LKAERLATVDSTELATSIIRLGTSYDPGLNLRATGTLDAHKELPLVRDNFSPTPHWLKEVK